MARWSDVRRSATALPGVTESSAYGMPSWQVGRRTFCWERPLTDRDRRDLGEARVAELAGPVLGIRVADQGDKAALLDEGDPFFSPPHFDGWPGLLVLLDALEVPRLRELVTDAWFAVAPPALAHQHDLDLVVAGVRSGLPTAIGAPATRALHAAGVHDLDDLRGWDRPRLLALHGVGPKAAGILLDALTRRG